MEYCTRTDTKPVEITREFPVSYSRLCIKGLLTILGSGRKEGASRMIYSCHCSQMEFCDCFEWDQHLPSGLDFQLGSDFTNPRCQRWLLELLWIFTILYMHTYTFNFSKISFHIVFWLNINSGECILFWILSLFPKPNKFYFFF